MAKKAISTPEILVNGDKIAIVPNSLVYDAGEGEINVRSASLGGGSSESVHTVDAESQIGMVKFQVYNTNDLDGNIRTWKRNIAENAISFAQQIGTEQFIREAPGLSLVNSIERDIGADGTTELEFEGDQIVI